VLRASLSEWEAGVCVGRAVRAQFFPSPPSQLPANGIFFRTVRESRTANRLLGRTGMYLGSGHSLQFLYSKFNALRCSNSSDQKQHSQDLPVPPPTARNKQPALGRPCLRCWASWSANVSNHRGLIYKARL